MPGPIARWLLLLPAGLLYVFLFLASGAYFFLISFWSVKSFKLAPILTLKNYATAFTTHAMSGLRTLGLAFAIALATTIIGFLYAWIIRFRAGKLGDALLFIALVTLFGGYLMKIYAWKTMLGSDGAINSALLWAGIVDQPVAAMLYSPFAVVLTLSHFLLPFAILPMVAALRGIGDAEVESARDLGASGWVVLRDVIIPRAQNGIMAAFALCFMISVGDYFTPMLVGGKMSMVGQLIAPQFGTFFNWPLGAAMSFSILACALVVLILVNALVGRIGRPA
ncbi:MAG: ABC transporter permease [Geminicoccaceae bacterium]